MGHFLLYLGVDWRCQLFFTQMLILRVGTLRGLSEIVEFGQLLDRLFVERS